MKIRITMSIPVIPLLLLLAFGGAQAQLRPEAQALVLDKQIINAIESGDHAAAVQFFQRRARLDVAVPPRLQIDMAKVYYALGDYLAAHGLLTDYLNAAASDSPHYDTALNMYVELEAKPEYLAQREKAGAGAGAVAAEPERLRVGQVFRDCDVCPEMVVVPSGSFMMGSPSSEQGRNDDEGPVHRVRIAKSFAVGVYEVTRGEFSRFVAATGHPGGDSCWTLESKEIKDLLVRNWWRPGFSQTNRDPVVCVNWNDAQAYTRWLSGETGEEYRLLSESEWEYVARAGTRTARYWGASESGQCHHANGADRKLKGQYSLAKGVVSCDDGHVYTAPVGSYVGNGYGLHDVLGNVMEWTQDCWSYVGAPSDGSAMESGDCSRRVLRGGSWYFKPRNLRSAIRFRLPAGDRSYLAGIRVARTLTP